MEQEKELIEIGVKMYLNQKGTISKIESDLKIKHGLISKRLKELGYSMGKGYKLSSEVNMKKAANRYIECIKRQPSLTKIASEYHVNRGNLSKYLKNLGYDIINHQNKLKFDNTIFDVIDTEEKAYWLGFIFADGYVSNKNDFELSLSIVDIKHLQKFNKFINHTKEIKNDNYRCRLFLKDSHFVNRLKELGCISKKSLILQFPNLNIFKSKDLIKHFIRGYWDGDGCLSYCDIGHQRIQISVLGTEDFLTKMKENLPLKFDYKLGYNNKAKSLITRTLQINGNNAFELTYYLYENASIYLDRKFEKYKNEYCRLYEESYKKLETNIGEDCDVNPEITEESNESSVSYSVETETEKSE